MPRLFGVAGIQMSVVPWDPTATIDKMVAVAREVHGSFPWVQMLVFPELVASGAAQFVPTSSAAPWQDCAQTIPGPHSDRLCDLARMSRMWVVPGSMYESDGGKIYNTSLAISPEGTIVAKYRKMFPWLPYETESEPGSEFCVFDVPSVGRFGLCICYDAWFPEVIRTLAWMGAEVIIHPTLTPTSDRGAELVLNQANAIFNQCYVVDINGLGPWGGGRSSIVDPEGRVLQQAGEHDMIMTELLNLDQVAKTRQYGTLGLCQTWKQFRDFQGQFPMYQGGLAKGPIFNNLGPLSVDPRE
ncbi:MAG TPA: carbon-nitrogen hydrolase family protein [Anaerolineales bacterium]